MIKLSVLKEAFRMHHVYGERGSQAIKVIEALEKVDRELGIMERWAHEQENDAFANQVRQWATAERSKLWATFDFGDDDEG